MEFIKHYFVVSRQLSHQIDTRNPFIALVQLALVLICSVVVLRRRVVRPRVHTSAKNEEVSTRKERRRPRLQDPGAQQARQQTQHLDLDRSEEAKVHLSARRLQRSRTCR